MNNIQKFCSWQRRKWTVKWTSSTCGLVKREASYFSTAACKKPTQTEMFTRFSPHHHTGVKSGTVTCQEQGESAAIPTASEAGTFTHFHKKSYTSQVISCRLIGYRPNHVQRWRKTGTPATRLLYCCLYHNYTQRLLVGIQIACCRIGVRRVFKSGGTFRQLLVNVVPDLHKKKVVYRIPCKDCGYSLHWRDRKIPAVAEFEYAVKNKDGTAIHTLDADHQLDQKAAEIVETK